MKPQEGERLESRESQPLLPTRHPASAESTWRVLAACVGFLADSYDLFTIDIVVLILQLEHGEELVSARAKSMMVSAMLAGVVIGQLSFGYIADWLGRKWSFVTTAALTILGALSCALCSGAPIQMSVCRFFLGLGVGGEYPLSATAPRPSAHWSLSPTESEFLCPQSSTQGNGRDDDRCKQHLSSNEGLLYSRRKVFDFLQVLRCLITAAGRGRAMALVVSMQDTAVAKCCKML